MGGSQEDNGYTVLQTADGGYICSGYSFSPDGDISGNHGLDDGWVVKLDAMHNIQWQRSLGGSFSDQFDDVILSPDGGYLLVGYSRSKDGDITFNHGVTDLWITKLNSNGNIVWEKCYGGTKNDAAREGILTPDGGYIIVGFSQSQDGDVTVNNGKADYWIIKIDANGLLQWQRSYGSSMDDYAYNIEACVDGNYFVSGYSGYNDGDAVGNHGACDAWTIKIDPDGNLLWQKNLGGSSEDVARSAGNLADGCILVAGYTKSNDGDISGQHGNCDGWIGKLSVATVVYADNDADGFGNKSLHISASGPLPGYVSDSTDCDDNNPFAHPGAPDLCNGIDDNCNGTIDENALAAVITPGTPQTICDGSSVTISASGSTGICYQWKKGSVNMPGATDQSYIAKKSGNYAVYESNGFNCSSLSPVVKVTVKSVPVANITANSLDLCAGNILLTATTATGNSYQWEKGTSLITGATNPTYTATKKATYKVIVSNNDFCSKTSDGVTVINSCKEEPAGMMQASAFQLYPNPNTGLFSIEMNFSSSQSLCIHLYNLMGTECYFSAEGVINGIFNKKFDLTYLSPGTYFLKVVHGNEIELMKVVLSQ
jgi:hypothetical protein